MTYKTITDIPLQFIQSFDSALLSRPMPKFCDDSETLWQIYIYIKEMLSYKCRYNKIRMNKLELVSKEFLELYGRAKTKEIEFEKETGKSFQGPSDYFFYTGRNNKKVFSKIRSRGKTLSYSDEFRKNHKI